MFKDDFYAVKRTEFLGLSTTRLYVLTKCIVSGRLLYCFSFVFLPFFDVPLLFSNDPMRYLHVLLMSLFYDKNALDSFFYLMIGSSTFKFRQAKIMTP